MLSMQMLIPRVQDRSSRHWLCSSVVEHLPSWHKAGLSLISSTGFFLMVGHWERRRELIFIILLPWIQYSPSADTFTFRFYSVLWVYSKGWIDNFKGRRVFPADRKLRLRSFKELTQVYTAEMGHALSEHRSWWYPKLSGSQIKCIKTHGFLREIFSRKCWYYINGRRKLSKVEPVTNEVGIIWI